MNFIKPLHLDKYQAARSFNVLLFLILFIMSVRLVDFRIIMLPVLMSPQIWYVFSYFNSDAFALFITLLACYFLVNTKSFFHTYLHNGIAGKGWIYLSLSILLFGCLLLLKKNFYFFIVFLLFYLCWAFLFKKLPFNKIILSRIGFVFTGGLGLFLIYCCADFMVNSVNRDQKLEIAQEKFAHAQFRSNTSIGKENGFLNMRERGIPLREVLIEKRCLERIFKSSFGQYGYTSITASTVYYVLILTNLILLSFLIGAAIFLRGELSTTVLLGTVLLAISSLLAAVIYHAWCIDFQPQGRYLLPGVGMVAIMLHHSIRFIPRSIFNPLLCSMFLLGIYSFIFTGLYEIEKFCY